MRTIPLAAAVGIALAGCAVSPSPPSSTQFAPAPGANEASAAEASASAAEPLQLAAIMNLQPVGASFPDPESESVVCRDWKPTGTRIVRTECARPVSEGERLLQEEQIRWDLDHIREMTVILEQQRIQDSLNRPRQPQTGPRPGPGLE